MKPNREPNRDFARMKARHGSDLILCISVGDNLQNSTQEIKLVLNSLLCLNKASLSYLGFLALSSLLTSRSPKRDQIVRIKGIDKKRPIIQK